MPKFTNCTVLFTVSHKAGSLQKLLGLFQKQNINLEKISSRPSRDGQNFEIQVDIRPQQDGVLQQLKGEMAELCSSFEILGSSKLPWFPRKMGDLDKIRVLEAGGDLESDHPGFSDPVYRQRRAIIAKIAMDHRQGENITRVDYSQEEVETWGKCYDRLRGLYPEFACKQLNYVFPLLEQNCGYSNKNIPQLEDISRFLKDATGFTIRPVSGLLSSRDFLNGLAFRVFHSSQYLRHHSRPFYTPEPDIVHELMGHVPLFADPDFADFSQEIGLASIGVSDEAITQLARNYWFTVEFGLCLEDGKRKAYGAGLLSSFGELEWSMSDKPQFKDYDPFDAANQEYPITTYQPVYYLAKNFEDMKERMRKFSQTMERSFAIRYNPYTESIEVLDTRKKLLNLTNSISSSLDNVKSALKKVHFD